MAKCLWFSDKNVKQRDELFWNAYVQARKVIELRKRFQNRDYVVDGINQDAVSK